MHVKEKKLWNMIALLFCSCVILGKLFKDFLYLYDQNVNTYLVLIPTNYIKNCQGCSSKGLINVSYKYYHLSIVDEETEI